MRELNPTGIHYEEFRQHVIDEHCGTLSKFRRPIADEMVWRATTTLEFFLSLNVYPVWLLGPQGGSFHRWQSPDYRRILFRDALKRQDFRTECSLDRHPAERLRHPANVAVLHCTTCDHAAIIDGNHRLTILALNAPADQPSPKINVIGLSGSKWAPDTNDINKVCSCLAPQ